MLADIASAAGAEDGINNRVESDVRVAVKAVSANPVDYKVRKRAAPPEGEFKILGFDAAGIVDPTRYRI